MDKEMQAKINEILKADGRRELKMDELEQVNGGYYGNTVPKDYRYCGMTEAEAGYYLQAIYDQFGLEVAERFAAETWSEVQSFWHNCLIASAGQNPGYYAVGMVWQKVYNADQNGGTGY